MTAGRWALRTSSHLIPTITPRERHGFYPRYRDGETDSKAEGYRVTGKDVTVTGQSDSKGSLLGKAINLSTDSLTPRFLEDSVAP